MTTSTVKVEVTDGNTTYRVGQIKRGELLFLLVTVECIYKI